MNKSKIFRRILFSVTLCLVGLYFFVFLASHLLYGFAALIFGGPWLIQLVSWTVIGLVFSLLSSLCAWPISLCLVTLLRQNQSRPFMAQILRPVYFLASLPLVLVVYIFAEVFGIEVFSVFRDFWMDIFGSHNFFTRSLAFTLTILFYPFSTLLFGKMNTDVFFQKMLDLVNDFAQVGLFSSVLIFGLTIFIIPKMFLTMNQCLEEDKSLRRLDTIQSIGGTKWQSVSITLLQSMREHFNRILAHFVRICFFEGLIVFFLLNFFFSKGQKDPFLGSTLASRFVFESLKPMENPLFLLALGGFLSFCYFLLLAIEKYYSKDLLQR